MARHCTAANTNTERGLRGSRGNFPRLGRGQVRHQRHHVQRPAGQASGEREAESAVQCWLPWVGFFAEKYW